MGELAPSDGLDGLAALARAADCRAQPPQGQPSMQQQHGSELGRALSSAISEGGQPSSDNDLDGGAAANNRRKRRKREPAKNQILTDEHSKNYQQVKRAFKRAAKNALNRSEHLGFLLYTYSGKQGAVTVRGVLERVELRDQQLLTALITQMACGKDGERAAAQAYLRAAPFAFLPAEVMCDCRPAEVVRVLDFLCRTGVLSADEHRRVADAYREKITDEFKEQLVVADRISEEFKALMRAASRTAMPDQQPGGRNFMQRVQKWLVQMYRGEGQLLSQEQGERLNAAMERRRRMWSGQQGPAPDQVAAGVDDPPVTTEEPMAYLNNGGALAAALRAEGERQQRQQLASAVPAGVVQQNASAPNHESPPAAGATVAGNRRGRRQRKQTAKALEGQQALAQLAEADEVQAGAALRAVVAGGARPNTAAIPAVIVAAPAMTSDMPPLPGVLGVTRGPAAATACQAAEVGAVHTASAPLQLSPSRIPGACSACIKTHVRSHSARAYFMKPL